MGESFTSSSPTFTIRRTRSTERSSTWKIGPLALHLELMPHGGPHPREKLRHAERLCDVIVGTEIERRYLARLVAAAREHDDRDVFVAPADHPKKLDALDVRKAEVEDDQVGVLVQQLEPGFAVGGLQDVMPLRAQPHTQELADGRLIVDDQHTERRGGHAAVSSCRGSAGTGSVIVKTAPLRSVRLAALTVPCMASTKPREMARPRPVPAWT